MNATLQTLLQYLTDPCDLADSLSAFIQARSEKIKPTMEALSGVIDGTTSISDFTSDTSILHKFALSLDEDNLNGKYVDLDDLVIVISESIEDTVGDPTVAIYDFSGQIIERIPLSETLDRIHSTVAESEMLVTSLNIAQQVADGDSESFLVTSFAKIEGYLQDTDLSTRLKGIFTSIYEEIRENVQDPYYLVESILTHFGMIGDNNDPRRNDVSEYTGQSPRLVLVTQIADSVGWVIDKLPRAVQVVKGLCLLLIATLANIADATYRGIQKLTYKGISKLFELGDGIQKTTLPGRGLIKHPGFSVVFDANHTSFPTGEEFSEVFEELSGAIGAQGSSRQQYTIPFGPIVLYIDWNVTKVKMTYDIKPLDYKLYRQVYYEHFNHYPYLSVKSVGGSIKEDVSGNSLEGRTREELLNFIQDLYSRNNLWGMEYDFDSDRYMCIQASKHLMSILYALAHTSVTTIDSTLATECNDACVFIDITKEYGYRSDTQSFIPENINFASICTELGHRNGRVDCFYTYLNDNNELDFTDNTVITQIQSITCDFLVLLGHIAADVIDNDPLSTTTYFVPYFHKFKIYRPSYYIPTDTENVDHLKRMIVTGITVVGVIVAVVVCVYLAVKLRKRVWMMEQTAAQKAFTASETGNILLLQQSWEIQKRVNLLGLLSGANSISVTPITTGVTSAIRSIKGTNTSGVIQEVSLNDIKRVITGE